MQFLDGLDSDIKRSVLCQLRDLWTYTSTGLEGNTLSLGDTQFVLSEGLTISGKPIKDHQEVIGHAKAIELIYALVGQPLMQPAVFDLHKAVQTEHISDIYKPYGAYKKEPNGTYAVTEDNKQVFIEYALPSAVESLMTQWIDWLNVATKAGVTMHNAAAIYAQAHMGFVHIHPFFDGNGRLARLLANLPLLASGLPPIVIAREARQPYLKCLSEYQLQAGQLTTKTGVWPKEPKCLEPFTDFISQQYHHTQCLLDNAHKQHNNRR